jgi:hypothetical protein
MKNSWGMKIMAVLGLLVIISMLLSMIVIPAVVSP